MSKHTPGPWEVDGNTVYALESAGWHRGVERMQNRFSALVQSPRTPSSELEANARLIAAAPELLEACQTFAEWLRREEGGFPAETRFNTPEGEAKWREWFDENLRICDLAQTQARSAIAKARGDA